MKILVLIFVFRFAVFAQPEFYKWQEKEIEYRTNFINEEDYKSNSFLSHLQKIYTFIISEPDGDNCPFSPSCSNFFVEAVDKTNFFTGILLFADRFTRDMNPFKSLNQYNIISFRKLSDPVDNYLFKN
ncbi:membrane protein insertion efficiency factor YidD [Stygiobacter electus]|uniref:Membrane protein insertion efficiency factor YidD n=1 Tax=Stygiobacter electus TaxID=3032292 RepID=A0AAE3P4G8_9BACT|nr:membrane protein insertion efficiency factor YidD [Stygiobacter electus]MDF1612775.1 membrane protein insertion efficiency factor YidD [Stygiobacter electus]